MKKNVSKILTALLAVAMMASMAACGGKDVNSGSSTSPAPGVSDAPSSLPAAPVLTPVEQGKAYADAITGARTAEFNDAYSILTNDRDVGIADIKATYDAMNEANAAAGISGEEMTITDEDAGANWDSQTEMTLSMLGFTATDVESYAVSVSLMNIKAYGIAVVKPAAGKEDVVVNGLSAFIQTQQKNFETYLVDQYEVAKAGYVKTLDDGTVIMVVSEGQDEIYNSIVKTLTGK